MIWDKTMDNQLIYITNNDKLPLAKLKLLVEKYEQY